MARQQQQLGWDDLFLSGSIVDVSTSLWRARTRILPQDLGIENTDDVHKALSLGQHRLLPAKAFGAIVEARGAALREVEYHSLQFGMIRGARYVPNRRLAELLEKLRSHQVDFYNAVGEFVTRYGAAKNEMLPVIESALMGASRSQQAAAHAFQRIQAEYPTEDEVRARFALTWQVYSISRPRSNTAVGAAAEETENVKSIIRGMVEQLRGELGDRVQAIIGLAEKGGKLNQRSINSALELVDRVEQLNVVGDVELSRQLAAFRGYLQTVNRKDVGDDFVGNMRAIEEQLTESVEQAVAAAETNLTGVGRRQLAIGGEDDDSVLDA